MKAEMVFEMCAEENCDCDLPHLPEDEGDRIDYIASLAQIIEWRIGYAAGYKIKYPD